jgi:ferric-dicitrate binding protein FerR (iron transport regulator)
MNRRVLTFCIVAGLAFHAAPLMAVEGQVVFTEGEVLVRSGSTETDAHIGLEVGEGDVIETLDGSIAVIALNEGTEIKLRENTVVELDSLDREVSVALSRGGVFSRVVGQTVDRYSVKTEFSVAGVRGTEFFIAFGRTIEENPDIWLCVNSGSVEVSILATDETVIVEEGLGINILGSKRLTEPKFYPWTTKLNWNMDPDAGQVVDDTDLDQAYSDLLDQDYD